MGGYDLLTALQWIVLITGLVTLGVWLKRQYDAKQPERARAATKNHLMGLKPVGIEDQDPTESARRRLEFLKVPGTGKRIFGVPCLNPGQEANWEKDREVLSLSRIIYYLKGQTRQMEFIELGGDYAILSTGKRAFLLQRFFLTTREQQFLMEERDAMLERNDKLIPEFHGLPWDIQGAFGQNYNPKPGERDCSYIQLLKAHSKLNQDGFESTLPPEVLDQAEHPYFDLEATCNDKLLYAFYCESGWSSYMGRELNPDEMQRMQGI